MLLIELFSSIPRGDYHPALGVTFPLFSFTNPIGYQSINNRKQHFVIFEVFPTWYHSIYILLGIACLYSTLCYFNCRIIFNCIKLHDYYTILSSLFDGHLKFTSPPIFFFFLAITVNTLVLVSLCTFHDVMPRNGTAGLRVFSSPVLLNTAIFCCRTTVPIYTPTYILMFCFLTSLPILMLTSS